MSENTGFRILAAVLLAVLLIAGAAAIGYSAYNAGLAQSATQAGGQVAPAGAMPYYGYPMLWHYPFGFGFLGCLAPLFFLLFIFLAIRLTFGMFGWRRHGPWGWRGGPGRSEEMRNHWREKAEAWHREMHEGGSGEGKA